MGSETGSLAIRSRVYERDHIYLSAFESTGYKICMIHENNVHEHVTVQLCFL